MKYKLTLIDKLFNSRTEAFQALQQWCEENKDELLDLNYPEGLKLYGRYYSASKVLSLVDPTAYQNAAHKFVEIFIDHIEEVEE